MSTARQRAGLRGVSKLRRTLRRIEPESREGIAKAVKKGAEAIEADMMIGIPKDTGDTAALISHKIARDGLTARVGFIGKRASEQGYVARFIEYGTKGYPKRNIPPQSARPFMGPAFDANKDWIVRETQREIARVIADISRGDGTNE